MKVKKVHLINNNDLHDLIQFADSIKYCINNDRNDLALEEIERFKRNIKKL